MTEQKISPVQLIDILRSHSYPQSRGVMSFEEIFAAKIKKDSIKRDTLNTFIGFIDQAQVSPFYKVYLKETWAQNVQRGFGSREAAKKALIDDFGIYEGKEEAVICESRSKGFIHEREYFLKSRRYFKSLMKAQNPKVDFLLEKDAQGETLFERWETYLIERDALCILP